MNAHLRLWWFLCSIPVILRVLGTYAILSGPWSLIAGVVAPTLSLLAAVLGTVLVVRGQRHIVLILLLIGNTWLTFEDVRVTWSSETTGVKVMTWNTALGYADQHRCVQKVLGTHQPDILALQEIREVGLKGIQTALDMNCTWAGYFPQKGSNGLGLCVPKDWNVRLAQQRPYSRTNPYAYLFAEVQPPKAPALNVMNVHLQSPALSAQQQPNRSTQRILGHTTARQIWQLFEVMRVAQDLDDPLLIAGDFNSTPNTWVHGQLRAFFWDAHRARGLGAGITRWIRGIVPVRIDYLYASKAITWSGITQSMDKGGCSDHAPVVGYLNLNR